MAGKSIAVSLFVLALLCCCTITKADVNLWFLMFAGAANNLPNFQANCPNQLPQPNLYNVNVTYVTSDGVNTLSEPQTLAQALIVFNVVTSMVVTPNPLIETAMVGTYSPYLSSLAQSLSIKYYIVTSNDNTQMPLNLMQLYYQSQIQYGQGIMPYSVDFNNFTRVVNDSLYLYNAILQIAANIQSPLAYFQNITITNIALISDTFSRTNYFLSWVNNNPNFNINPYSIFTVAIEGYTPPTTNPQYLNNVRPNCASLSNLNSPANASVTCTAYDIVYQLKMSNAQLIVVDLNSTNQIAYLPCILYLAQWLGVLSNNKVWVFTNNYLPLSTWVPYSSTQAFFVFLNLTNLPTDPDIIICQDAASYLSVTGTQNLYYQYRYAEVTYVEATFVITQYFYGNVEISQYSLTYFNNNNTQLAMSNVSLSINTWTGTNKNTTQVTQNNSTVSGCAGITAQGALLNLTKLNKPVRVVVVIEEPFVFRRANWTASKSLNNGSNACLFLNNIYDYQGFSIDILSYLIAQTPGMSVTIVEVTSYCPTTPYVQPGTTAEPEPTTAIPTTTPRSQRTTTTSRTTTGPVPAPQQRSICTDLNNGYAALSAGALLQTSTILSYVSASMPIISDVGVTVLMRNDTANLTWSFILPLSNAVWYFLIISIFLLSFTFVALDKIAPNNPNRAVFTWLDTFWYTFGSFTFANAEVIPTRVSSRILSIVMWFSAIVVVSSYTAGFATNLVNPTPSTGIADITSLYSTASLASQFKYGIQQSGIAMEMFIALNGTSTINSMWSNLLGFNATNPQLTFMSDFSAAGKCLNSSSCGYNWVYIGDENINTYQSYKQCSQGYITQGTAYWSTQYVIGVPPGANYLKDLNNKLTAAFQANVIQTYFNNWFGQTCPQLNIPYALSMNQLLGLYLVLAGAMGIAVVIALAQFVLLKMKMHRQRAVWRDFTFAKEYNASVIAIKPEGMEIVLDARKNEAFLMLNEYLNPKATTPTTPQQKGISVGSRIQVKYLGYDPKTTHRMFLFSKFVKDKKKK